MKLTTLLARKTIGLALVAVLILTGCTPATDAPTATLTAPTATTATASATSPAAAPSRSPITTQTLTPSPTTNPETAAAQEAAQLLRLDPFKYNLTGDYPSAVVPYAVRLLDYLYRYPDSPQRFELMTRLVDTVGYLRGPLALDWVVEAWMVERVVEPFQAAGGIPPGFAEKWQAERGVILETDLDTNQQPDYLLTMHTTTYEGGGDTQGGVYWLYFREDQAVLETLAVQVYSPNFQIVATQDLDGNGSNDLAYSTTVCSRGECLQALQLITRQNGRWQSLAPILTGDFTPTGGGWKVKQTETGVPEIIGEYARLGEAGGLPAYPFQIHFQLRDGVFIPVALDGLYPEGASTGDITLLQWADQLIQAQQFTQAQAVLASQDSFSGPFGLDYTPFALFRSGMVALYLGDVAGAQQRWDQLLATYPDLPLSQDMIAARGLVQQPEDAWRACQSLRQLSDDWSPFASLSGAAGEGGTAPVNETLEGVNQTIISLTQATPTAIPVITTTGQITPTPAAALATTTTPAATYYLPLIYLEPFALGQVCSPFVLTAWQPWSQETPLEAQIGQLGLTWQPLSADFDLNADGVADPIGVLETQPWAFLSTEGGYRAIYAAQTLPIDSFGLLPFETIDFSTTLAWNVVDLDQNAQPEILVSFSGGFGLYQWIGRRFTISIIPYVELSTGQVYTGTIAPSPQEQTVLVANLIGGTDGLQAVTWQYSLKGGKVTRIDPPEPDEAPIGVLTAILDTLFRDRDPQAALTRLEQTFSSDAWGDDIWSRGGALSLRALAWAYTGLGDQAQAEWAAIADEFRWTAWGALAKDMLP